MEPFVLWGALWALSWCGLFENQIILWTGNFICLGLQFLPFLKGPGFTQCDHWLFLNQVNDVACLAMMLGWAVFCETFPVYGWVVGITIVFRATCHFDFIPPQKIPGFLENKAELFLLWVYLACEFDPYWRPVMVLMIVINRWCFYSDYEIKAIQWVAYLAEYTVYVMSCMLILAVPPRQDLEAVVYLDLATILVIGMNYNVLFGV
jgi:hypothetical protein